MGRKWMSFSPWKKWNKSPLTVSWIDLYFGTKRKILRLYLGVRRGREDFGQKEWAIELKEIEYIWREEESFRV